MATILLIGEDSVLLRTRAAVLRKTGAEIAMCEPHSALAVQAQKECELVLLCHSLSETRRAALAASIRENWPRTKILQVSSDRVLIGTEATTLADAICSWEPERLIGRTVELLNAASSF
jgi:DNA-binding NarL/FixJ family response regulator